MTPPLAFLNVEEMRWRCDLGLPNQRRWLNHRYIGDEHRRTFPSAALIVTQKNFRFSDFRSQIVDCRLPIADCRFSDIKTKPSVLRPEYLNLKSAIFKSEIILELKYLRLTQCEFIRPALLSFDTVAHFQ